VKVSAELPGIDEADVDVRLSDGMLVISGEKKTDREVNEKATSCGSEASVASSVPCRCPTHRCECGPSGLQERRSDRDDSQDSQAGNGAKRIPVRSN